MITDADKALDEKAGTRDTEFQELIGHSVIAGLCLLVPVPFLDDWLRDLVRRRLARRLAAAAGLELDKPSVEILACGFQPITAYGCLRSTLLLPFRFAYRLIVKKILRKIIFVLAIKDCVDTFSVVFHESYLLRHALLIGAVPEHDAKGRLHLRHAIETVRDEVDHRPVERWARKAFHGSWQLLVTSARRVTRRLRGRRRLSEEEAFDGFGSSENPELDAMVGGLADEIRAETTYLRDLETRLERRLTATTGR